MLDGQLTVGEFRKLDLGEVSSTHSEPLARLAARFALDAEALTQSFQPSRTVLIGLLRSCSTS
jgi:hypothetical protein